MPFNQDEFNEVCNEYVAAMAGILDKTNNYSALDDPDVIRLIDSVGVLDGIIESAPEDVRADLLDNASMLTYIAEGVVIFRGLKDPEEQYGPYSEWFAQFIGIFAKTFELKGRRDSLVEAANEAVKLGND